MNLDIDQSGRVENRTEPTVLAFANGIQFTIRLEKATKQKLLRELGRIKPDWKKKQQHLTIFSILMFLLIKDHLKSDTYITIDREFDGQDEFIRDHVMALCRKHNIPVRYDQLQFALIGKKSSAHAAAINTYRGNIKPNRELKAEEVLAEL